MSEDDDRLSPEVLSALQKPASPPPSVEEATVGRLRAMGVLRAHRRALVVRPLPGFLALASALLVGFLVRPTLFPQTPRDSRHEFLLLLYGDPQNRHMERRPEYVAWARGLASRGELSGDGELTGEVETLNGEGRAGTAGDAPIGFFILRAHDRAEARQLSLGCPHLLYGGHVELRPFFVRP